MPTPPRRRLARLTAAAALALAAACADRPTPVGVAPAPSSRAPIPESGARAVSRTWTGALSTDWAIGGNWSGGFVPGAADTAFIPAGVPRFPVLNSNTSIAGVTVDDLATLDLSGFVLTASGDVHTGPTAGSGIVSSRGGEVRLTGIARTVQGRFPAVSVSGTYSLAGAFWGQATQSVDAGRLTLSGFPVTFIP